MLVCRSSSVTQILCCEDAVDIEPVQLAVVSNAPLVTAIVRHTKVSAAAQDGADVMHDYPVGVFYRVCNS